MSGLPPASPRLLALDVFRGLTIAAMILVNNPGSWARVYAPLRHADWHGWTPTDLIFPFFVFIVGAAIAVARPKPPRQIQRRGAILWGLGLCMAAYPFWPPERITGVRILGVLARLGICYAATALLARRLGPRALAAVVVALLLGYWLAMAGYGHLDAKSENLAARIDQLVLGSHVWSGSKTYDPEGVLSTLPAIATCLLGLFAGRILAGERTPEQNTLGLFVFGTPLVVVGYLWGWSFPINKPIWTSSYVLLTAGQAACALAFCHWLCDVRGWRRWARPFEIYGVNAITVFVGSGLLAKTLGLLGWQAPLYRALCASWLPPYAASLAWALLTVGLWFVLLAIMWRRRWILRI